MTNYPKNIQKLLKMSRKNEVFRYLRTDDVVELALQLTEDIDYAPLGISLSTTALVKPEFLRPRKERDFYAVELTIRALVKADLLRLEQVSPLLAEIKTRGECTCHTWRVAH